VGLHGGITPPPDKADMVTGLACLAYFGDGGDLRWLGRQAIMEITSLKGSLSHRCITKEIQHYGTFCGEWVPHLVLKTLRLYAPEGHIGNPNTQYRQLCLQGNQLKDVVHWAWIRNGELRITALTVPVTVAIRRQIGHLMRLLVLNFPQLLE
jgi:hypothetical protein